MALLLPKNLEECAVELLVEAYDDYKRDLEIQAEIIRRLEKIWNKKQSAEK